jgi:hypothetical protein
MIGVAPNGWTPSRSSSAVTLPSSIPAAAASASVLAASPGWALSAGVISAVVGERAERVVCARTSAEQARSRSPVVAGRCWGPGVRGVRKAHPAERRDVRATLRRSGAAWTLDRDPAAVLAVHDARRRPSGDRSHDRDRSGHGSGRPCRFPLRARLGRRPSASRATRRAVASAGGSERALLEGRQAWSSSNSTPSDGPSEAHQTAGLRRSRRLDVRVRSSSQQQRDPSRARLLLAQGKQARRSCVPR